MRFSTGGLAVRKGYRIYGFVAIITGMLPDRVRERDPGELLYPIRGW